MADARDRSRRSPSGPVSQYKAIYTFDTGKPNYIEAQNVTTFQITVEYARVGDIALVNRIGNFPYAAMGGARVVATDTVEFEVINPRVTNEWADSFVLLIEIFRAPMNGHLE